MGDPQGAEAIIATAVDTFGRVDCVVNNAGILRDRIFHKMTHDDFDAVVRVHLMGSFNVSRAAATHFREQKSGSFIFMTSSTGLIGNAGQANYGAAKLGIVGLARGIAIDMGRYNVRANLKQPPVRCGGGESSAKHDHLLKADYCAGDAGALVALRHHVERRCASPCTIDG